MRAHEVVIPVARLLYVSSWSRKRQSDATERGGNGVKERKEDVQALGLPPKYPLRFRRGV
jgi:hypothetical protein